MNVIPFKKILVFFSEMSHKNNDDNLLLFFIIIFIVIVVFEPPSVSRPLPCYGGSDSGILVRRYSLWNNNNNNNIFIIFIINIIIINILIIIVNISNSTIKRIIFKIYLIKMTQSRCFCPWHFHSMNELL